MNVIDLRSDTVTKPSVEMLQAICSADTGDDVYGEDATVNRLQVEMAELFGKEAGLFVPTGVMSNQLAIKALTCPGDEVIVEQESHIFNYETAAPSMMSAVQLHTVPGRNGILDVSDVEKAVRPFEYYYPRTSLVCLENTHNRAGGTVCPIEDMLAIGEFCREQSIALHLDGARIWNAHIATGTPFSDYGSVCDSISICFSKGLGAPVGSMLLGERQMIKRAHKYRKIFGGGMRQSGILAAAAEYGVRNNLEKLRLDHEHAQLFAQALAGYSDFRIDLENVHTNMVLLDFETSPTAADEALRRIERRGIRIGHGKGKSLRAVFHIDLDRNAVEQAIAVFSEEFN